MRGFWTISKYPGPAGITRFWLIFLIQIVWNKCSQGVVDRSHFRVIGFKHIEHSAISNLFLNLSKAVQIGPNLFEFVLPYSDENFEFSRLSCLICWLKLIYDFTNTYLLNELFVALFNSVLYLLAYQWPIASKSIEISGTLNKVIYTKYSKHWPYTVAHTIDCVCRKC